MLTRNRAKREGNSLISIRGGDLMLNDGSVLVDSAARCTLLRDIWRGQIHEMLNDYELNSYSKVNYNKSVGYERLMCIEPPGIFNDFI